MAKNPTAPTVTQPGAEGATPEVKVEAPVSSTPELPAVGSRILVSTVQGVMVHLHTNETITTTPSLHTVDDFTRAQIEAGKWVVTDMAA